ncbi:MAG TPA: DnaA/Hda family protein [Gemmatimonadaceae bacterium]
MPDSRFRFETFVVGPSNRLAVSAARAVAEAPGKVYNPLFVYGESGLGKTHLLSAIGLAAATVDPALTVEYRSADEYVEQWQAAVDAGDAAAFRRQWEDVRLLLLDDVQFLANRTDTQSELLRLINTLQVAGRQVVMASDRPPAELDGLDQRLLTRMSGGLIVDIAPPEFETRAGILRALEADRGVAVGEAALEELARAPIANVRELHGLFNRLLAQHSLSREAQPDGVARAVVARAREERAAPPDEFEAFVSEVAAVVSSSVEQWRVRLAATVARWAGEGFRTGLLDRHLDAPDAPDLDALEARFASTVNRLRDLEREAARLDPRVAGVSAFRDPERVDEAETILQRALAAYDPPPAASPHFTIENLAPGVRNQLALRAAGEVIALPATRYNPLYLHGPSGAGKTHLAHAIANALAARDGASWTIACLDCSAFSEDLIDALRAGALERWRLRYRAVDALVIDNVDRLAGNDRSQDEVFYLFDALRESGRQIVLTAGVPPARLRAVAPRLVSRFESGLVVEIGLVSDAEAVARHTPVPDGAEAAAPTIDAWFDEAVDDSREAASYIEPTATGDSFFLDPEKVITEWPSIDGRLVEEPR